LLENGEIRITMYQNIRYRANKGFSLTELIIYILMATIVFGVIISIFLFVRSSSRRTTSSFEIREKTDSAVRWLKTDLMETSLSSIRAYPNNDFKSEAPGVSFISAVDETGKGGDIFLDSTDFGNPSWQKYVFYTVVEDKVWPMALQDGRKITLRLGKLVRWEYKQSSTVPSATTLKPFSDINQATTPPRTILNGIMLPAKIGDVNQVEWFGRLRIPHVKPGGTPQPGALDYGGFRVSFVRRKISGSGHAVSIEEELSNVNPSESTDTDGNTDLIQVDFIALNISDKTGQPTALSQSFQLKPRN